jgi:hypothetical protein
VTAGGTISRPRTGINGLCGDVGEEELSAPWPGRRLSALRVHHRCNLWDGSGQRDSAKPIGLPLELPRRILRYSRKGRRLIVVRFHTPFWRRVEAQEGNEETISPGAEEMANHRRTIADGFPHWSKLQHRAP